MRYFYDCEFIEDGTTVELISIGAVDEQGREFYAVSTEFDPERAGPWVRRNVLPKLPPPADRAWQSRDAIRRNLLEFLREPGEDIELWAWFAAYDHIALAQLWGAMPALPRSLPRFTRELRQRWDDVGRPTLPPAPLDAHDALADARHNLARWRVIQRRWEELGLPAGSTGSPTR
ncbi:polyadenylate-specific 3'-exoribonuclease AS [Actinoalloteichus hymeniacidonis]|uniref:3'-5' exoribonuclease n=1 Tax=Actinoalloteichus hymeniacidonis TaxID=340345 RepID=A0AAC9HT48_9PSEU|nr:polyadenylate-specific 3'-exoribonuclease AS [Actinoalloteichus hymeniacidonis]AOS65119.1 hypothetical protein TL08_21660 [Actinoalloteichus hymeniacidonis]MBB5906802.1 hypothetical protein [Actinoalloteichus hymeniacidonis]